MKRRAQQTAKVASWPKVAALVAAPLGAAPALTLNIGWTPDAYAGWNMLIVGSVAGAAFFATASWHSNNISGSQRGLFGALAALLMAFNMFVAFGSASHKLSDSRDLRQAEISDFERLDRARSQLVASRAAAVSVAGEKPQAALSMDATQIIAANARRWAATNQCDPGAVTAPQSMQFCADVAAARGRLAAADRRDAIDDQLAKVDQDLAALVPPASADPFTDGLAKVAAAVGVPLSDERKAMVPVMLAAMAAVVAESLATFLPLVVLVLCEGAQSQLGTPRATPHSPPRKVEAAPVVTDNVVAFSADRIERDDNSIERAGALWKAWQAWCEARSIDPGTQRAFGFAMARQFKHDRNSGRPVYRGVRLRADVAAAPHLVVPFKKRAAA